MVRIAAGTRHVNEVRLLKPTAIWLLIIEGFRCDFYYDEEIAIGPTRRVTRRVASR